MISPFHPLRIMGVQRAGVALCIPRYLCSDDPGPGLQLSYLGGLPAMYCLNLWWFNKIVDASRRALSKGKAE